jgi:cell division protein FtsN
MADRDADSGIELVLDNRKFIIAFVVLIAICGCFFVIGFVEGKRQGIQESKPEATASVPKTSPDELEASGIKAEDADVAAKSAKEGTEEQQLNWYKNVNRREGEPEVTSQKADSSPAHKTVEPAPAPKPATGEASKKPVAVQPAKSAPQETAASSGPVTYSVQVGAFRVRQEAENKGKTLKAKGFDCRIDVPKNPDDLYLLKVGKFSSRADAVAMQLRLKKSGIASFIKTN